MSEPEAVPRLLFSVGETGYLLPLDAVAEVTPAGAPRLVPGVPLGLGGILNVRGEPIPVVDGGAALAGRRCPPYRHAILMAVEGDRLGVLVSAVSRIERASPVPREVTTWPAGTPPFVTWVALGEREVGMVEVAGFLERVRELLGAATLNRGGVTWASEF